MIGAVKKELRPVHENVSCDVCGRTILKGEGTEAYLSPDGRQHEVCELCFGRAEREGWIRASAAGELPARAPRPEPRRSLLGRLRRPRNDHPASEPVADEPPENGAAVAVEIAVGRVIGLKIGFAHSR